MKNNDKSEIKKIFNEKGKKPEISQPIPYKSQTSHATHQSKIAVEYKRWQSNDNLNIDNQESNSSLALPSNKIFKLIRNFNKSHSSEFSDGKVKLSNFKAISNERLVINNKNSKKNEIDREEKSNFISYLDHFQQTPQNYFLKNVNDMNDEETPVCVCIDEQPNEFKQLLAKLGSEDRIKLQETSLKLLREHLDEKKAIYNSLKDKTNSLKNVLESLEQPFVSEITIDNLKDEIAKLVDGRARLENAIRRDSYWKCSVCNRSNRGDLVTCQCGNENIDVIICEKCGNKNSLCNQFCQNCVHSFDDPVLVYLPSPLPVLINCHKLTNSGIEVNAHNMQEAECHMNKKKSPFNNDWSKLNNPNYPNVPFKSENGASASGGRSPFNSK